jgi:hypothetical protein
MRRFPCRPLWLAALAATALWAAPARADIRIVLQNEFIEQYRRRVTIDTTFTVDKAHAEPNKPSKDGDLHVAGRADEVKLPIVAEIMNARDDQAAVDRIHAVEGTGQTIPLAGAWRLWCEHGGTSEQIQGAPLNPFTTTNPDHVFEVHPITALDGRSLLPTLKPIQGFKTKDAEEAFGVYERVRCTIIPGPDTTTLVTTMAGYNYVEFVMELNSEADEVADGVLVMCKVLDLEGELLVRNRRTVLVKDSEAERQIRGKPTGTRVHVLGIPRINLSLVSWRLQAAAGGRTEVLRWGLPYEIIVVGFYGFMENEDHPIPTAFAKAPAPRRFVPRTLTPKELDALRLSPPTGDPDAGPASKGPKPKSVPKLIPLSPRGDEPQAGSKTKKKDLIEEK